jgi:hypothetical protein
LKAFSISIIWSRSEAARTLAPKETPGKGDRKMENTKTGTEENMVDNWDRLEREKAEKFLSENKLTLKSLKIFKEGSQETICFHAKVILNGKEIATAENDGHGASTNLRFEAEVKEKMEYGTIERIVDDLVAEEMDRREISGAIAGIRRAAKRRGHSHYAYKVDGGAVSNVTGGAGINDWLAKKGYTGWTVEAV